MADHGGIEGVGDGFQIIFLAAVGVGDDVQSQNGAKFAEKRNEPIAPGCIDSKARRHGRSGLCVHHETPLPLAHLHLAVEEHFLSAAAILGQSVRWDVHWMLA